MRLGQRVAEWLVAAPAGHILASELAVAADSGHKAQGELPGRRKALST